MSADLPETPNLGRTYCPACEPEADPLAEILETQWCADHKDPLQGYHDLDMPSELIRGDLTTHLDSGSEHRAICNAIHRPHGGE